MPKKKIKSLGWALMLIFPVIIGSSYFIFFSNSLKIFSEKSIEKQEKANSIEKEKEDGEEKTVIKGVIATKANIAPEKIEKGGELWPDKESQNNAEKHKEAKNKAEEIKRQNAVTQANSAKIKNSQRQSKALRKKQQIAAIKRKKRKLFSVRIGIFRMSKNAGILVNKARKEGYQAFVRIKKTQIREKRIYIGSFTKIPDVRKARNIFTRNGIENHPQMSKGQTYSVYLGPFPLQKNTKNIEALSRKNGYKALVKIEKTKRDFSYVWVGKFNMKEKAMALASKLKKYFPDCVTGII